MAQAAKKASTSTSPKLKFIKTDKGANIMAKETARGRTLALASDFNGKPLAEFKAAWEAQATRIHGDKSVFPTGKSKSGKAHQAFSGWLSWLKREGHVSVG